ncbi:MAG TPA: hypothetical protein ENL23_03330, partial [Candidatus Acetothermia bacterium]|nr:hypothetical protein [Candidatus Acetothermia bacterium]
MKLQIVVILLVLGVISFAAQGQISKDLAIAIPVTCSNQLTNAVMFEVIDVLSERGVALTVSDFPHPVNIIEAIRSGTVQLGVFPNAFRVIKEDITPFDKGTSCMFSIPTMIGGLPYGVQWPLDYFIAVSAQAPDKKLAIEAAILISDALWKMILQEGSTPRIIEEGSGVEFLQINFEWGGTETPNSDTGYIVVDRSRLRERGVDG